MKRSCLFLLGILLLLSCNRGLQPETIQVDNYWIAPEQNIEADSGVVAFLAPYKEQLEAEMNEVIGEAGMELNKAKPESTLGNWVADLTHTQCEAYYGQPIDFAIANYGGLRISQIPAGPITRQKIFELMPFDNLLVVLEANGTVVHELFALMAEYGGWPISHTVRYQIKDGKPQDIRIHGLPVALKKTYKIGVSDFVANGGDRCFFFEDQPRTQLNHLHRDAMIEFVEKETAAGRKITAKVDGRVMVVE